MRRIQRIALAAMLVLLVPLIVRWIISRTRQGDPVRSQLLAVRTGQGDTAVVFVHGVFGSATTTFEAANGTTWPNLLTEDPLFKDADVYVYGYSSDWTTAGLSINQLAADMHLRLSSAGVLRHKRVVFVCHSMGGLVTRSYLLEFADEIRDKVGFVYFFATPTSGASIAAVGNVLAPHSHLANMAPAKGDAFLQALQTRWVNAGYGLTIRSYCAYETVPTEVGVIVHWTSALSLCNASVIAIEANHMGIVKPVSITDKPHVALRTAYLDLLRSSTALPTKLVPATAFAWTYQRDTSMFGMTFTAAMKSSAGALDAVVDVYAVVIDVVSGLSVPFGSHEARCVRAGQQVELPFVLGSTEIMCTFEKRVGQPTFARLTKDGKKRVTFTLETDDNRGHTAQYCFQVDAADVVNLAKAQRTRRRSLYSLCE